MAAAACTTIDPPSAPPAEDISGNAAPRAIASPGGVYVVGYTVPLDGSSSFDTDGDALAYSWARTKAPANAKPFVESAGPTSSFYLETIGLYEFVLSVTDEHGAVDTSVVAVECVLHDQLVLQAGLDSTAPLQVPHTFSPTLDVQNATDVIVSARFLSTPPGTTTFMVDADTLNASFTPDRVGEYVVEFRAESPWAFVTDTISTYAIADQHLLPKPLSRAVYSPALDRLAYLSDGQIHIFDLAFDIDELVPLFSPTRLDLSLDGSLLAIVHHNQASPGISMTAVVDLATASVLQTFSDTPGEPIFDANSLLYVLRSSQVRILDLTSGLMTTQQIPSGKGARLARTQPGVLHLFSNFVLDDFIQTIDISNVPTQSVAPAASGITSVCDDLWTSIDGDFVVTGCGDILGVTFDPSDHLGLVATLPVADITHVAFANASGLIAVVHRPSLPINSPRVVEFFEDTSFTSTTTIAIPKILHTGSPGDYSDLSVARVFFSSDETELIVVGGYSYQGANHSAVVRIPL